MRHLELTNEKSLIKLLEQHGIQAMSPSLTHESHLHWWQYEGTKKYWENRGIKYFVDVALVEGYLFLELTEQSFNLYLQSARDDWYNLVRRWSIDVPEKVFIQELKEIVDHNIDEIYEIYG